MRRGGLGRRAAAVLTTAAALLGAAVPAHVHAQALAAAALGGGHPAVLGGGTGLGSGNRAPALEPAVFSVRVGQLPPRTVPALVVGARRVLLPFGTVMEMAGVPAAVSSGGERFGAESGAEGVLADTVWKVLRTDSQTVQLGPSELAVHDGEVYVAVDRLADLLVAEVVLDWSSLRVNIHRDRPFRSEAALAGAQRRAQLAPAALPAQEHVPYVPRSGGMVLDWEFSAQSLNLTRSSSLSPTLNTALLGGELKVGAVLGTDARGDAAPVDVLAAYRRVFPNGTVVRQLEVGDVTGEGPSVQQLRGVRVTNTPHSRESVFGLVPIQEHLPPGWEYEVYQGGRLVGFSDAVSDGAPPALVRYGSTDVRIREIGPDGQERTRDLTFSVPYSMVGRGSLRYDLGAGQCRWRDACEAGGFASARYGVTHGVTVGAGMNLRTGGAGGRVVMPFAGLAFANAHGLQGELQAEHGGAASASVQYVGNERVGLYASASLDAPFGRGVQADAAAVGPVRRRWASDASATVRLGTGAFSSGRITTHVDGVVGSGAERWHTSAALYHSGGTLEVSYADGATVPARVGVRGTHTVRELLGAVPASFSGGASFGRRGAQSLDLGASVSAMRWASVSAGVRWDREGARRPVVELGLSAITRGLRLQTRASSDRRVGTQTLLQARGSIAEAGLAGVSTLAGRSGGSAGISGLVFYDRDGDGRYTAGDSVLAGQEVQVAGVAVRTDARGRYVRWRIAPYDVASVRIHPEAVADPSLTPAQSEQRVRPVPNRAVSVDFAIVRTRAVGGAVTAPAGTFLGGIGLELRDGAGAVVETRTFEDGAWYIPRLAPGHYTLRVAASSLDALGAAAEPVAVVVPADGDEELTAPVLAVRKRVLAGGGQ